MFPDDFFGEEYFANDYYPPEDASSGAVGSNDYVFWFFARRRHRVVS